MSKVGLEDVSAFTLSDERRDELLATARECTFTWTSSTGQSVGVSMSYLWREGAFWLGCIADSVFGDKEAPKAGMIATLDTPHRVVLRVTPDRLVNSYDGDALRAAMTTIPRD